MKKKVVLGAPHKNIKYWIICLRNNFRLFWLDFVLCFSICCGLVDRVKIISLCFRNYYIDLFEYIMKNVLKEGTTIKKIFPVFIALLLLLFGLWVIYLTLEYYVVLCDGGDDKADIVKWWSENRDPRYSAECRDVDSIARSLEIKFFFPNHEELRKSLNDLLQERITLIHRGGDMGYEVCSLNIGNGDIEYLGYGSTKGFSEEQKRFISFLSLKEYPDINCKSNARFSIMDEDALSKGTLYGIPVKQGNSLNRLSVGDLVRINNKYKGSIFWEGVSNSRDVCYDIIHLNNKHGK